MHIDYVPFFLLNSVHDKIVEADTALMRIVKGHIVSSNIAQLCCYGLIITKLFICGCYR